MSDAMPSNSAVAGPGFPRLALGLAWLGSTLASALLGLAVEGLAGRLLLGAAVVGVVALAAVVSNRYRRATLAFSGIASGVVVIVGLVAAAPVTTTGDAGLGESAAVGALPVIGGLLTHRLSRRARQMADR